MSNGSDSYFFGEVQEPGVEEQLFLHSYAYADRWDVEQQVNKPAKYSHNPVLMPDQLWEQAVGMPNVLYDQEAGMFRMWYALYDSAAYGYQYGTSHWDAKLHGYPYMISYAESPDGIHWDKPLFDRIPYGGFGRTNIVFTGIKKAQEFHVLHSPEPVRERGRFMLCYRDNLEDHRNCLNIAFSDDGIDWKEYEDNPIYKPALDMQSCLIYDDRRGIWLLYARPHALAVKEPLYRRENIRTRCSVAVSEDLREWAPARVILAPDELDRDFFFDRMSAMKYGNQFVGFVTVQPRDGDGNGYMELVSSPDGLSWYRSPVREPFIGPGREGDWDGGHTWMLPNLTSVGEWIYMYYVGSHRPWRTAFPENTRAIGMARMRRGRFAAQYAGIDGGYLLSREIKVSGNRLLVNCARQHRAFSRRESGSLKVELFDRTSSPHTQSHAIEGYSFDDCEAISINGVGIQVRFNGSPDISALMGKNVYLRFFLKATHLFGYQFVNVGDKDYT